MSLNAKLTAGKKMPLWPDLGALFGAELSDFSPTGTLDAISAYEHEYGRVKLIERLTQLLHVRDSYPGDVHAAFCSMSFDIVCTTNFDFLLERQYELIPKYVYPVVDEDQLSIDAATAGTLLLKLHGDLRHPGRLIVTESDYDEFLGKYPLLATYLANLLITKTAIFIGYSIDNPDFRQLWSLVQNRLGKSRRIAYCIAVGARPGDIARYERRGVKVINIPGSREKYGEILSAALIELRDYARENVLLVSKVTEEEPLRELSLPRDSGTRLCFFSIPVDLISFYKNRVFPIAEELGFVPVSADDIISPGDNTNAKIDALIDRASVMLVDLSSQWTRAEYDIALSRSRTNRNDPKRTPLDLIVVLPEDGSAPNIDLVYRNIRRPTKIIENPEGFLEAVYVELKRIAERDRSKRKDEPRRLYEVKEYGAAVVAAMTKLEVFFRNRVSWRASEVFTANVAEYRRPIPMSRLLSSALEGDLIQPRDVERVQAWMRIRNSVVHDSAPVSKVQARDIVEGVEALVGGDDI